MKNFSSIIIGGTGQFGIHIGQLLQKKNYNVFITSRKNTKNAITKKSFKKIKLIKLDIYNKKKIKKVLTKIKTLPCRIHKSHVLMIVNTIKMFNLYYSNSIAFYMVGNHSNL